MMLSSAILAPYALDSVMVLADVSVESTVPMEVKVKPFCMYNCSPAVIVSASTESQLSEVPPEEKALLSFAAKLLNRDDPPIVDFLSANLSDMVKSFYSECKRVDNSKIKSELLVSLKYPNYEIGLKSLLKEANLSL